MQLLGALVLSLSLLVAVSSQYGEQGAGGERIDHRYVA